MGACWVSVNKPTEQAVTKPAVTSSPLVSGAPETKNPDFTGVPESKSSDENDELKLKNKELLQSETDLREQLSQTESKLTLTSRELMKLQYDHEAELKNKDAEIESHKKTIDEVERNMAMLTLKSNAQEMTIQKTKDERSQAVPVYMTKVVVVEANNLKSADFMGKSDPYAIVQIGQDKQHTHVIDNELSPKWNHCMSFCSMEAPTDLKLIVFDKDEGMVSGEDDSIGEIALDLRPLFTDQIQNSNRSLQLDQGGEIKIIISCSECKAMHSSVSPEIYELTVDEE